MARKAIIGLFKEDDMYEVIQLSMIDQYKRVGKKFVIWGFSILMIFIRCDVKPLPFRGGVVHKSLC